MYFFVSLSVLLVLFPWSVLTYTHVEHRPGIAWPFGVRGGWSRDGVRMFPFQPAWWLEGQASCRLTWIVCGARMHCMSVCALREDDLFVFINMKFMVFVGWTERCILSCWFHWPDFINEVGTVEMDEERHEKLMWNVTVLGAAENVFPVWGWSFLGPSVCKEGTGYVLLSVLAIHSEMVSGVKVEITNSKEVRGKGPVKWNIKSVGSNVWERL